MNELSVGFAVDIAAVPETAVRVPLTIIIPALNEAGRLDRLLPTLRWADEVIVVDGGSADETVAVSKRGGARVFSVRGRTIGAQRNAGIMAARNRWILALDADEMISRELREELAALATSDNTHVTAYRVRSRNWYLGRELRHGPWGSDWKVRVFTSMHRFDDAKVHENLAGLDYVGTLTGTLLHWSYRDVPHHVAKGVTYARWAVQDLRKRGRPGRLRDILIRPPWRFLRDYILMSGWRDGVPGFVASVVSAFYVFLKYATLLTSDGGAELG